MKLPSLILVTSALLLTNAQSDPLWPDGRMPHPLSEVADAPLPTLHTYPTKGSENHTGAAVVICPGGGYGGLATDHEGHQPAKWFNERGVTAFVLHYRLGSAGYHYPAQLADVQRAVRTARASASELGLDPSRIAVMGFSAGGHLASMAATLYDEPAYDPVDAVDQVSARPDLAILCYPVISMDPKVTHGGSRKNLLGPDRAEDPAWANKVSSEKNVTAETPPTFLFQTDEDAAVPAENAVRFYLALRENGVPAEMHVYERGPHGVGLYRGDPVLGTWSERLDDWLRSRLFYSGPADRAAVEGEVTLDGSPVSWGVLTFHPENGQLPSISVRVRRGKFSAPAEVGPVTGPATITFEGSIWETTGDDADTAVQLGTLEPGGGPIEVEVSGDPFVRNFEFRSR